MTKICTVAGFLKTVEIGQYVMTKDTEEFSQFAEPVTCREYICHDEKSTDPKGWMRGNTEIGPVLEVTTSCLPGKYGVEIRQESVNKANSHSWVRISHGLKKLVTNLKNNEQETSEMQFEEYALRFNGGDFASRSKAKAKPQRRDSASSSTRTVPIGERIWTDVEPGKYSLNDNPVSKKLIYLLRHGSLPRDNDGAIEFWRIQRSSGSFCFLSSLVWRNVEERHGRKRTQEKISIVLILQEQFCTSELFKVSQDAILLILHDRTMFLFRTISSSTFIVSDMQSIYIPSSIQDWYREVNLSKRQTVLFLLVDPMDTEHKHPDTIDFNAPRLAQYMHKAWKKHQNTVYWVDINFALKKGLKFYQTRSNASILHKTLPACCIPKVVRMETGEVIHERIYASPRPPPKISLKHDWKRDLGSEVAQRPDGQVVQQF